mmetsp:Transcript_29296/g.56903  ORF Transcript_29296/g.56903 Transcript_29296/m.56903 type:complete len:220 (-) Transcript_29296:233-892(-)
MFGFIEFRPLGIGDGKVVSFGMCQNGHGCDLHGLRARLEHRGDIVIRYDTVTGHFGLGQGDVFDHIGVVGLGQPYQIGAAQVAKGLRRAAMHAAGQLVDLAMQDAKPGKDRIFERCFPVECFDIAGAIAAGHIDDHAARLHGFDHVGGDHGRCVVRRNQDRADHKVGLWQQLFQNAGFIENAGHIAGHQRREGSEPGRVAPQKCHIRAQSGGSRCGSGP